MSGGERVDDGVFLHVTIILSFFLFLRFYLFFLEKHRKRGRDKDRGRNRFPVRSLMRDLISGPQDHALSQRLNH